MATYGQGSIASTQRTSLGKRCTLRFVAEPGPEPSLDDERILAATASTVVNLIAADATDREVPRLGGRNQPTRNRRGRTHRKRLGQRHALARDGVRAKERHERRFVGVVRARGIAGRRARNRELVTVQGCRA